MSDSNINERVWYFGEHEINFVTVGRGAKNLLCLSAGTPDYRDLSRASWQKDWGGVLESYDRQIFRLLAFDPVGCGKSRHPNRARYMDEKKTKQIGLNARDAEIAALIMQITCLPYSFPTEVITRNKTDMRPYSILAKNDAVDVALRLAHDSSAVERLILFADNAYVTQWEMDNASKVRNATLVIRRRHLDSRGLIRKHQADFLMDNLPNASIVNLTDEDGTDPFVLIRDKAQAFLAVA